MMLHPFLSPFMRALLVICAVAVSGCSDRDQQRDALADRFEAGILADQSTDPAERRAVAESLAEDVMSLQADVAAGSLAEADGTAAARVDAERATVIAADCMQMRDEIEALRRLQRGDGERVLAAGEQADMAAEIERRTLRMAQNCS